MVIIKFRMIFFQNVVKSNQGIDMKTIEEWLLLNVELFRNMDNIALDFYLIV